MYLPLEYVKRYSVLTELYCSEEYINCEPEVLLEMIADADWGTSNYSGPNKERYIHTINEQISNFAQTYPTNLKASSNEALLFMRRYRFANCSCFSCCFKDAYPSSNVQ